MMPSAKILIALAICWSSSSAAEDRTINNQTKGGEFRIVKSTQLATFEQTWSSPTAQVPSSSSSTAPLAANSGALWSGDDLSEERASQGRHKHKHKNKKKKFKKKLLVMWHKLKKWLPQFVEKMYGPSMFLLGMAQANLHNFVLHVLLVSKLALISVLLMIVREAVFENRDQPVKYYNFGYDRHPSRRYYEEQPLPPITPPPQPHYSAEHYQYNYKRRRKRSNITSRLL